MRAFSYERATSPQHAAAQAAETGGKFIAGGTNLLDLMKLEIETPTHLIDVNGLGLDMIEDTADGGLQIRALFVCVSYAHTNPPFFLLLLCSHSKRNPNSIYTY